MRLVYYPLLKKQAWHCQLCLSMQADNLHFLQGQKDRYLIELFSGSKTVSRIAESEFNYQTFAIDIEPAFGPDLCTDIGKMKLSDIPRFNRVFAVWASIPCTFYTIMNIKQHWHKITYSHRKYYYVPVSSEARKAIQLLEKTLWLIKSMNPVYYFIENPRGALRHMPQMNFCPFTYTVSYHDFGADVYKPTDIFTNCSFLKLPQLRGAMNRTFPASVLDMKTSYERSIVPPGLIRELLAQVDAAAMPLTQAAGRQR